MTANSSLTADTYISPEVQRPAERFGRGLSLDRKAGLTDRKCRACGVIGRGAAHTWPSHR